MQAYQAYRGYSTSPCCPTTGPEILRAEHGAHLRRHELPFLRLLLQRSLQPLGNFPLRQRPIIPRQRV
jgi:hypothetical protein